VNAEKIKEAFFRLGFYFVDTRTENGEVIFFVGHVGECKNPLAYLKEGDDHKLHGPYAELIIRLMAALSRYESESQDVLILLHEDRTSWINELALQAGVTRSQFLNFVRAAQ
jgi:hypothetical protein